MQREVMCHAVNLFFEARGESSSGKEWVMDVVKNRVKSRQFPSTYCGVVTDTKYAVQFEWYSSFRNKFSPDPIDWEEDILYYFKGNPIEIDTWYNVFGTATMHYLYDNHDETDNSLFYRSVDSYVKHGEFRNTTPTGLVGNHIFFKPCRGKEQCSYLNLSL